MSDKDDDASRPIPLGLELPGGYRLHDSPFEGPGMELRKSMETLARLYFKFIMANRERYVQAWVAETGFLPSESELVETRGADGEVTVTVRRRQAT